MVEIKVLGPIQVLRDGEPVDIGGPTQRRLLASLVAQADQVVPVRALLEDLWGDDPPPSGPASIQSYVSRLRRALGPEVIETTSPGYRLALAGLAIDSQDFLEAAADLPGDPDEKRKAIDSALRLWNGPPFEDFPHVEYASRRLLETRYDLEEERARLIADSGDGNAAVSALEKITAEEPLRESAWATLGVVLTRLGRQAEAVRALNRYRDNLAQIGLEPGPGFEDAETEVFAERPPPTSRIRPIPHPGSSFVGRSNEVSELTRLLEENRLVSVVGPGGMGKTRLVTEAARARDETDVVFVRLESLSDHREVAPAVLNALGGETRGNPTESVIAHLTRSVPSLLVLDNAEHVIDTTAALVTEVSSSTATTVLITSREPLNIPGETVMTLGPLDPGSAIDLYRDRARAVDPDFEAPSSTLDMLCEELDYMPLAIEMAAARSKALAPEVILERISREYGLFDRPLRGGSERHRSLDAMVNWSYSLLEPPAQRVFERLSVVSGTFDVDLATALAGFGAVAETQVAGIVADLVEKSLVDRTRSGRFRMLRVLKSFAAQKLTDGPDEERTRKRHARWFAELATQIGEGLSSPDELLWIGRANDSVEDLGSALIWSAEHYDLDVTRDILEGLFDWFYHRHPPAITNWGDIVLAATEGHEAHSAASAWAALAAVKRHDMKTAHQIAFGGTDVEGPAGRYAWFMTGEVACYTGRLEDALDAFRRQMIRASHVDDRIGVIDGLAGEAMVLAFEGHFDRAMEVADELERAAAEIPAPTYRAYSRYATAEAIIVSDPERAADLFESAVGLAASVNNHFIQALAATSLGSVLSALGRQSEAIETLRTVIGMWDSLGIPNYQWAGIQFLGAVLAETGEHETAVRLLAAADKAGRRPFTAGQAHWGPVVDKLRDVEGHDDWAAEGAKLALSEATELALAATRPL